MARTPVAEYAVDNSKGPLLGPRLDTNSIVAEYAGADPIYQVKTAALHQTYKYYRTCKGDGHCGWRGE
ncbi:MAG: hypothetical protein INR71_11785 [Terriglobus roseus]|nr:hypothetical protein [Terriglobus roseus]